MVNDLTISVVIITRNRAEWLRSALESLTRQSRQANEVVVVDNASQDNTREIINSFGDRLNIKYVSEPTLGIPYARNSGIRNASGDIIASIDDDCEADEDWLKYIELPFIRDPNIGAVGGEISYARVGDGDVEEFYIKNMVLQGRNK